MRRSIRGVAWWVVVFTLGLCVPAFGAAAWADGAAGHDVPPPPPPPPPPPGELGVVYERQGLIAAEVLPCAGACDPCEPAPCADPCEDPCSPCSKIDLGPWSIVINLSWTQAGGNSDSLAFKVDFEAVYCKAPWKWRTAGFYAYAENDGTVTTDRTFLESQVDRQISSRFYAFAKGSYDHDEPASLDYRIIGTAGLGWNVLKGPSYGLDLELGGGATWEKRKGQPETVDPSAYVGLDFWKQWARAGKLTIDYDFLPNLDDFDLSLMRWDVKYALPITSCLNVVLGLRLDYQIDPVDPTVDEWDWIASAGIGISF